MVTITPGRIVTCLDYKARRIFPTKLDADDVSTEGLIKSCAAPNTLSPQPLPSPTTSSTTP